MHAGGDEADGDPVYGIDAIWAPPEPRAVQRHRRPAAAATSASTPAGRPRSGGCGVDIIPNHPTGVWVDDYTVQPENGGLSVFAHEYTHDLGLPDLYDTSGNTGGAENSVGFWSLMSQSRGTLPGDDGIGDRADADWAPGRSSQLGWLDYDVTRAGRSATHVDCGRTSPRQQRPSRHGAGRGAARQERSRPARRPVRRVRQRYFFSD